MCIRDSNRLESTDTNWDGQIVWSTLTKAGNNPGLTVEKKRLTIRGRNYILAVSYTHLDTGDSLLDASRHVDLRAEVLDRESWDR